VDVETGNIVIKTTIGDTIFETIDVTSGNVTGTGTTTITINPTGTLAEQVGYYVQIDATAFDDPSSNSYAGITDTTSWSFTTSDQTDPLVTLLSPLDDETSVLASTTLVMTFNEAVDVETGDVTIFKTNGDVLVDTIDITGGSVTGTGTNTITITPVGTLLSGIEYYVLIDATALDDAASNSYAGIASSTAWSFTIVSSGGSSFTPIYPTGITIEVTDVSVSCSGDNTTATVTISANDASEYLISNDKSLTEASWTRFAENPTSVTWEFADPTGWSTIYYMLKSSFGNSTGLQVANVDLGETPASCLDESTISEPEEDITVDLEPDVVEDIVTQGLSPYDGSLEDIVPVHDMELIVGENYPTVYLVQNGTRRPYTNETAFYSWHTSQDSILHVTNATLSSIPLGAPVLYKPGVVLVKIQSDARVFAIEVDADGNAKDVLRWVSTEDVARDIYGDAWAEYIIDIQPTEFARYSVGEKIEADYSVDTASMLKRSKIDSRYRELLGAMMSFFRQVGL